MQESEHALPIDGRHPLQQVVLTIAGREWRVCAVRDQDVLVARVDTDEDLERFPYGLTLWSSAVGLAAALTEDPSLVSGRSVLEIGAGVGLPGMIAASLGASVIQTDWDADALALAQRNASANGIRGIRTALLDWRDPGHRSACDVILGADVLYERELHPHLARLFEETLMPAGSVIIADPLRPQAITFVEQMEAAGWRVVMLGRRVEWEWDTREVAIFRFRRAPCR